MTPTQRNIGVIGAVVATFLLMYPPWRLDYEGGYSRIAYAYLFSPPADYGVVIGDTNVRSPQTQSVAVWMLFGELAAVGTLVAFLMWLYRPAGYTTAPDPAPAPPASA